jgi:RNA polymerase sigma-70 factor (ECF subfamily)
MTCNLVIPSESCYEISRILRDRSLWMADVLFWFRGNFVKQLAEMDEVELLRSVAQGDRDAFGRLYDLHSTSLFSVAARILNDTKAAEDVLQEVFIQVWRKAGTYRPELGKPFQWLLGLTRNKAVDQVRSSVRRSRLTFDAAENQADDPAAVEEQFSSDQKVIIRKALAEIPIDQRKSIELAYFGGLSQSQIAEQLGEPLGTIKARIRRGMLKLRDVLEGKL